MKRRCMLHVGIIPDKSLNYEGDKHRQQYFRTYVMLQS